MPLFKINGKASYEPPFTVLLFLSPRLCGPPLGIFRPFYSQYSPILSHSHTHSLSHSGGVGRTGFD